MSHSQPVFEESLAASISHSSHSPSDGASPARDKFLTALPLSASHSKHSQLNEKSSKETRSSPSQPIRHRNENDSTTQVAAPTITISNFRDQENYKIKLTETKIKNEIKQVLHQDDQLGQLARMAHNIQLIDDSARVSSPRSPQPALPRDQNSVDNLFQRRSPDNPRCQRAPGGQPSEDLSVSDLQLTVSCQDQSRLESPSQSQQQASQSHSASSVSNKVQAQTTARDQSTSQTNNTAHHTPNTYKQKQKMDDSSDQAHQDNLRKVRSSGREMRQQLLQEKGEEYKKDRYDRHGFVTKEADEDLNLEQLREREGKWLKMLDKWDKTIKKEKDKVRSRCLKGLPLSLRGKIWTFVTGSYYIYSSRTSNKQINALSRLTKDSEPGRSVSYPDPPRAAQGATNLDSMSKSVSEQENNKNSVFTFDYFLGQKVPDEVSEQIERDLHRQFPENELFRRYNEIGTTDLRRVLYAYAAYNPKLGYCQGQGPIAGTLLMHMTAEEAFWTMAQLIDVYGFAGYYYDGLVGLKVDFDILYACLKRFSKTSYMLLRKHDVAPELFMTDWFMCAFARQLKWPVVLRLWDVMFLEGPIVLFKAAILIVDTQIASNKNKSRLTDMMEIIETLKQTDKWDPKLHDPDEFVARMDRIKLDEKFLQAEYKKSRKNNPDLAKLIEEGVLPEVKEYSMKQPIDNSHLVMAREARVKRKEFKKKEGKSFREISMNFGV